MNRPKVRQDSSHGDSAASAQHAECLAPAEAWPASGSDAWHGSPAEAAAKARLARLARAIETDVIPRLVQAHRPARSSRAALALAAVADHPGPTDAKAFLALVLSGSDPELRSYIDRLRERGVLVETIYLELFAPTARQLGTMWESDDCDFSTVTIALGRLQRLLRELSPAFGKEVEHPPNGRRALFVQPRDEQHSFGLSMVAEFFRRDGWDVIGGVGGAVADPAAKVHEEWVDIVGFSIGSETRIDWLRESVAAVRAASLNRDMHVLVGGPLFTLHPEWVAEVGADGTAATASAAPLLAEQLMAGGVERK